MAGASEHLQTPRSRVRRKPERAAYDRAAMYSVIDEALHCHVGLVRNGYPVVLPTIHARLGDTIYLHGSPAAGHLRDARRGLSLCITFTLVDGLALTRSARNHSLSYRSAVVFGHAEPVDSQSAKLRALEAITNRIVPGRWSVVRKPSIDELRETEVLAVTILEGSVKCRSGPPDVDETNGANAAWAGVIPLVTVRGQPQPAAFVAPNIAAPDWYLDDARSP
jgi:nitroimidazol reductase NimA-like FMN-containing flavoprotein (pyridoxamine 5'-phosphate oxidase superfamily)